MRRWHFFKYQLYFNDNFVRYEVEIAFQRQFLGEPSLKWIIQRWFWRTSLKLIFFYLAPLGFRDSLPQFLCGLCLSPCLSIIINPSSTTVRCLHHCHSCCGCHSCHHHRDRQRSFVVIIVAFCASFSCKLHVRLPLYFYLCV